MCLSLRAHFSVEELVCSIFFVLKHNTQINKKNTSLVFRSNELKENYNNNNKIIIILRTDKSESIFFDGEWL